MEEKLTWSLIQQDYVTAEEYKKAFE